MTTPPDGPAAEPPAAEPPAAEAPAQPPPSVPPGSGYPPAYGYPAFAPVQRPPREPWINPAKRMPAAVIAVVVALVLLFGGLVVGFAIGHNRGDHGFYGRFEPGYGPLRGPGAYPRYYLPKAPPAQRAPAPSPSTTG